MPFGRTSGSLFLAVRKTMSVAGILGGGWNSSSITSQFRLTNTEFQQLGQDLASGNLSAAQSDFSVLQQAFGQTAGSSSSSTSAPSTSNPIAQAFQQLSSDLKSGNLTGAQKDYSTIEQDMQSQFGSHHLHNHHRIRLGAGGGDELNELNQLLQSGSSSTSSTSSTSAQQQYATLAQELQQFGLGNSAATSAATTSPVSLIA
jgi:hypothetical protein